MFVQNETHFVGTITLIDIKTSLLNNISPNNIQIQQTKFGKYKFQSTKNIYHEAQIILLVLNQLHL